MKNSQEKFTFSKSNFDLASSIIKKYPDGRQQSAVLPLLDLAQRQGEGWLSTSAMEYVAEMLSMPPIRVYEVATFYTMFNLKPVGKHHVQVCTTTPCWLRNSDEILNTCEKYLGIKAGETTANGMFTLTEVECLAACVNAPMIQIDDDYYEDLDSKSMTQILDSFSSGSKPSPGPQIDRQTSAPFDGPSNNVKVEDI